MEEVLEELRSFHPEIAFEPIWVETTGDKDLKTSLRALEKTDFFTKEIDALQKSGGCRISIHSAKDLPDPLPAGLTLVALTKGVDPSDSIVLRDNETLDSLPMGAKIGTSSARREKNIDDLRSDLECVDIRGNIQRRLALLDEGVVDGVVMAEAALIRLKLTHRTRTALPGERAELQGQLAVLALEGDEEMRVLFECIDVRTNENDSLFGDRSDAIRGERGCCGALDPLPSDQNCSTLC
jgi:hydroxymethylbilane synthase